MRLGNRAWQIVEMGMAATRASVEVEKRPDLLTQTGGLRIQHQTGEGKLTVALHKLAF